MPKKAGEGTIVKKLVENNIILQKKTTELLVGLNTLTKKIDRMLTIFEEAGKKVGEVELDEDKINALATKLEALLDQNKDIAKGLILLERYIRGRSEYEMSSFSPKSLPRV